MIADMSHSGKVKSYLRKRGFGFIIPSSGGKHLFVHWSDITSNDSWPSLKRDMEVKYDTKKCEKTGNDVACNVTDAGGNAVSVGDEVEHKLSTFTCKGTVKYFSKKGFGFIESSRDIKWQKVKLPAGTDIYASRENLVCAEGSVCTLRRGMEVSFKVFKREGQDGLAAAEVTDEDGNPLNLEPRDPSEKPKKKFKGKKKGAGKGKGGAKSAKGVKKTISKLAKSNFSKKEKEQKVFKSESNLSKIMPLKKTKGSSKGSAKGSSKGSSKGKNSAKGVKQTIQKIVYVPVPVKQYNKMKGKGGGKGAKGKSKKWY